MYIPQTKKDQKQIKQYYKKFRRNYNEMLKVVFEASDYIKNLCVKDKKTDGRTEIHLPLKSREHIRFDTLDCYDLSDEVIKQLKEYWLILNAYMEFRMIDDKAPVEMLPPWLIIPDVTVPSSVWGMGLSEEYVMKFIGYIQGFTEEEYNDYVKKYPQPKYTYDNIEIFMKGAPADILKGDWKTLGHLEYKDWKRENYQKIYK